MTMMMTIIIIISCHVHGYVSHHFICLQQILMQIKESQHVYHSRVHLKHVIRWSYVQILILIIKNHHEGRHQQISSVNIHRATDCESQDHDTGLATRDSRLSRSDAATLRKFFTQLSICYQFANSKTPIMWRYSGAEHCGGRDSTKHESK